MNTRGYQDQRESATSNARGIVLHRGIARRSDLVGLLILVLAAGCDASRGRVARYVPTTRAITVTTVPLLVKEDQSVLPFLKSDFAKGGVLDGKEVYGFSPSTITVMAGDTINFTFYNPEDDDHSFVLPDLVVPLPPQKTATARYVARHAGIYPFVCSVASHLPMMAGQLVVLSPPE